MAIPRDDAKAAYHIAPLKNEKMKTFAFRDSSQRVTILYEAIAGQVHDGPCLATCYYYDTGNNIPTASMEKEAKWDSAWDLADLTVNGGEV